MKTLQECVEKCARNAYNTYMGGSMESEWQHTNTEVYAWVFELSPEYFMKLCKQEYKKLFKGK